METDLASMMCADALALARSSLPNLTAYHSKAKKIFVVNRCTDSFRRLVKHRPDAQVMMCAFRISTIEERTVVSSNCAWRGEGGGSRNSRMAGGWHCIALNNVMCSFVVHTVTSTRGTSYANDTHT